MVLFIVCKNISLFEDLNFQKIPRSEVLSSGGITIWNLTLNFSVTISVTTVVGYGSRTTYDMGNERTLRN